MAKSKLKRFLIVDSNLCYARIVSEKIEEYVADAVVDLASNIWEVRRRLVNHDYCLILADTSTVYAGDEIETTLSDAGAPVIIWSALDGAKFAKPSVRDIASRVAPLVA